jgi:hypothetical protein
MELVCSRWLGDGHCGNVHQDKQNDSQQRQALNGITDLTALALKLDASRLKNRKESTDPSSRKRERN